MNKKDNMQKQNEINKDDEDPVEIRAPITVEEFNIDNVFFDDIEKITMNARGTQINFFRSKINYKNDLLIV
jgi:hypothetical protein